jgi:hypothetical protein
LEIDREIRQIRLHLKTDICIFRILFGTPMIFRMLFQYQRKPGWVLRSICQLMLFTLFLAPVGISAADQRREIYPCFQSTTLVPDLTTKTERTQENLNKISPEPILPNLPGPETFHSLDPIGPLSLPENPITPKTASPLEAFLPRPPPA